MRLLLVAVFFLVGCQPTGTTAITDGVYKYKDNGTTCYLYYQRAISCVRDK